MRHLILGIIITLLSIPTVLANEYKPWSENLFSYIKNEYGEDAEKRMRYLNKLALENQDKTDMEKLELAHRTINQFPWISDQAKWKQADYWATPLEIITTFGGDCEDMVFAKWLLLRHLGVSKEHLYFAHVTLKGANQAHMVLLYQVDPDVQLDESQVYIIDNMDPDIRLAKERKDLKGVYALHPSGTIYGLKGEGADTTITNELSARQFKSFAELKEKFLEDREHLKDINDGEYLLPEL